ncbi:hypothetical protein [Bosea sp. BH3]|uniref:hypothetical protein n=1 Tax=Bosea sp. BH3 TaxID=2871701 RepID=UPI0021CB8788|nr:hypothetical protein [Bosea sp. BH3]MCU4181976.1 hypothetical protein [Bosea sp. BH3]
MRSLLMMVGMPDLPLLSIIIVCSMIVLTALLFGWISDMLMGDGGFGITLNAALVLIGAFLGAWAWQRFGVPTRLDPNALRAAIALGSGLVLLVAAAVLRP